MGMEMEQLSMGSTVQSLINQAHDLANSLGSFRWNYSMYKQYHMLLAPKGDVGKFKEIIAKIRPAYRQDPQQTLAILNKEAGNNGVKNMDKLLKDERHPHVTVKAREQRPACTIS